MAMLAKHSICRVELGLFRRRVVLRQGLYGSDGYCLSVPAIPSLRESKHFGEVDLGALLASGLLAS